MNYLLYLFEAFLTTYVVEFFIVWLFLHKRSNGLWLNVLLINLLTWPLVQLFYDGTDNMFVFLEAGAIVIEGIALKYLSRVGWGRVALAVCIANVVTALIGLAFYY